MKLIALLLALQCPNGTPPPCAGARGAPRMSVAVLDLQNMSRDTADAWLAQGIAGELTSRLGHVSRLTVVSRTTVQRLRNPGAMTVADLGRALNAAHLVSGTVQRSGPRIRVTIELVRAATGAQVWSEQFDRTESDLLEIQEAVTRAVAAAVTGRLLPGERAMLEVRPTRSAEAYAEFLRGRALQTGGEWTRSLPAAAGALERAVALDPEFAEAWSALARVSARMYWVFADRSASRLERARVAAERARGLAPDAPTTHLALGYYYYWGQRDYGRALGEFATVLAREPNNVDVHQALANVARRQGDFARNLASRTRARELDPGDADNIAELGLTSIWMRRFDEGERYFRLAASMDPGQLTDLYGLELYLARDGSARAAPERVAALARDVGSLTGRVFEDPEVALPLLRLDEAIRAALLAQALPAEPQRRAEALVALAQANGSAGRDAAARVAWDSARSAVRRLLADRPDEHRFHAMLGLSNAALGDCAPALDAARHAAALMPVERDAMSGAVDATLLAQVEAQCGELDSAAARVERLLARPSPLTVALLRSDPVWAPLRGRPAFDRLIAGN